MNRINKSICIILFLIFCALSLSFSVYTNNPLFIGRMHVDSGVFTYIAKLILNGGMPYRDSFDHKGPLLYLINLVGLVLHGQIGIWIVEVIIHLSTLFIFFKMAKLYGLSNLFSCLVVWVGTLSIARYLQGGNFSEEYANLFISISLYIFMKYFKFNETNKYALILCGASFTSVCLLRINMIALWAIMCLGVLIDSIKKKNVKDLFMFVFWFVTGCLIVIIPIFIWLISKGAFFDFIEDYFLFNFAYSSDSQRASNLNIARAIFYFMTGSVSLFMFPILLFFCFRDRKELDILCLSSAILSILMSCISGQNYDHYALILGPLAVYSAIRLFSEIELEFKDRKKLCSLVVFITITFIFARSVVNLYYDSIYIITGRDEKAHLHDKTVASIIEKNTDEGDLIFVFWNHDSYYVLSNRNSVSKYSYQMPIANIDFRIAEQYLEDIVNGKPKIVVVDKMDFIHIMKNYQAAIEYVNQNYDLIDTVSGYYDYDTDIYLLKENKD